jgi:hypothetical protein
MDTRIIIYLIRFIVLVSLPILHFRCSNHKEKAKILEREKRMKDAIELVKRKEAQITPITKRTNSQLGLDAQLQLQDSLNKMLCSCFASGKNDSTFKLIQKGANIYTKCSITREEFNGLKAIGFFMLTAGTSAFIKELNRSENTYTERYIDFVIQSGNLKKLKKLAKPEYGWELTKINTAITQDTAFWYYFQQMGMPIEAFKVPFDVASCPQEFCAYKDYSALRYLLNRGYPVNKISDNTDKISLFAQFMLTNSCDDTLWLKRFVQKGANLQTFNGKSWLEVVLKRKYISAGLAEFWDMDGQKSQYAKNFLSYAPKQFEYLLTHGVSVDSYPDLMRDLTMFCEQDDFLAYFRILKKHKAISFTEAQKKEYIQTLSYNNNPKTMALLRSW